MPAVRETIIDITDPELKGNLREFGSPVKAAPWTVGRGDSGPRRFRFVEPTGNDRRTFKDANTTNYGIEVAVGNLDAGPTSGTYAIEINTEASASIAYNATAQAVEDALNDIVVIQGQGGVTVEKYGSNSYQITWNNAGTIDPQFVPSVNSLEPETGVYLTTMVAGDSETRAVQWLRLLQVPIAYQNSFTAYPVGAATVEVLVSGDATHKELVRISLDEPAWDGAMIVTLGTSQKFSIACVTNAANALNSTGFIMSDTAGTVGVWFNVASGGTAPAAILACDRQLEVTTVGATDNRATVATKLATAINADAAFTATSNGGAVKVTLDAAGDTDNPADVNTTFTFTTIQEGTSISASVPITSSARDFAAALGNVVNVAKTGDYQWDLIYRTYGNQSDIAVEASALFPSGYEGLLNFITRQCFKLFASDPDAASFSPYLEIALTPPGEGSFTVYHAPITLLRDIIVNEQQASAAIPDTYSINTGNLVYVDDVLGDDSEASRQRFDRPFLTPAAAKTAATSGDTIIVRPGTYTTTVSLLKAGVNWHCMEGVTISTSSNTVGIWDDAAGAVTCKIGGRGVFTASGTKNPLNIVQSGSHVEFECDLLDQTNTGVGITQAGLYHTGGYLAVRANTIRGYRTGAYWNNGEGYITAFEISSVGAGVALYALNAAADQHWHVTADYVFSAAGTCLDVSGNASARVWMQGKRMVGDSALIQANCVAYVSLQKLSGGASGSGAAITLDGGELHFDAQKVEGGDATDELGGILLAGGLSFINIGQFVDTGIDTFPVMTVSGGEHFVKLFTERAEDGHAVVVTGGAIDLEGSRLDTSVSTTHNPISMTAGTIRLGGGTRLISNGSRKSIANGDAGTYTVDGHGAYANNDVDTGITANGLVVDSTTT